LAALLAGACALAAPAASAGASSDAATTAPGPAVGPAIAPCAESAPGGDRAETLRVDGERRDLLVHVPRAAPAGRELPLILALHGFRSSGVKMEPYTGFSALADRGGFVVAYPSAVRGRWRIHASEAGAQRDLDFMRAAIARIASEVCVNVGRVFAAGVSNGGGEVARMGCALGGVLDGIATVAGDYRRFGSCDAARPLSLLEIHGGRDPVVPYFGQALTGDGSVPGFLARWRAIDRCSGRAARRRLAPRTTLTLWRCPQRIRVQHVKLDQLGHAWPGASPPPGRPPGPSSATRRIWGFFRTLPSRRPLPSGQPSPVAAGASRPTPALAVSRP
jgi:polyhydroxybutyrate depolymerase